jgi:hypothetical protein
MCMYRCYVGRHWSETAEFVGRTFSETKQNAKHLWWIKHWKVCCKTTKYTHTCSGVLSRVYILVVNFFNYLPTYLHMWLRYCTFVYVCKVHTNTFNTILSVSLKSYKSFGQFNLSWKIMQKNSGKLAINLVKNWTDYFRLGANTTYAHYFRRFRSFCGEKNAFFLKKYVLRIFLPKLQTS